LRSAHSGFISYPDIYDGTLVPAACPQDSTRHVHFQVTPGRPGLPSLHRRNAHWQEEEMAALKPGKHMCPHLPACPAADRADRDAARTVASHPEQGWSLLCNGVIVFDDLGEILPGDLPAAA